MALMPTTQENGQRTRERARRRKLSRLRKPDDMSLETWQRELRREFGRGQRFRIKNVGPHPVFSEYHVTNPESQNTYRVLIRGREAGDNHCSCPDFSTNTLGTCKHIEFALAWLARRRGGSAALGRGY